MVPVCSNVMLELSSRCTQLSRDCIPCYRIGRSPSSVVVVRRRPHSLNIFFSETTEPIEVKFHMELLWDRRTKVCSNGPGHMTKVAAMPMYGKNLKKSSSLEPKGWWPWNLVCIIGCSSTTKFAQMMTLGWPWTILRQCQFWSLMLLYGKKVKQWTSGAIYMYKIMRKKNVLNQTSKRFFWNL